MIYHPRLTLITGAEDEVDPVVAASVASAAATAVLSVIMNPPLGMFPPQGLPQPTGNTAPIGSGGGGSMF